MVHSPHGFLADLAVVLCVAALTAVVCHRLRQPAMLGYILAGMIIGPHIPIPLVADRQTVETMSELGMVLLMFSLGLEFSLGRLAKLASTAGIITVVQVSLTFSMGYGAGSLFGWSPALCAFAGGIVSISSTIVVARLFAERGIRGQVTEIAYGILIYEDLVAILMLAALTAFATAGTVSAGVVAGTVRDLAVFLAILLVVGLFVVPRLFRGLLRWDNSETLLVASLGVCFAVALLTRKMGFSVALGAFLAGVLIAESEAAHRVDVLVRPLRDMFGAIFFVAVGMLVEPRLIVTHWPAIVLLTVIVILGKAVGVVLGAFLVGLSPAVAVQTGMALAQIGEFSFVMAGLAAAGGGDGAVFPAIAVGVAVLTTFTTPWLVSVSTRVAESLDRTLPRPLQTLLALYGSWLEQIGITWRAASTRPGALRPGRLLALDAALLALVAVGGTAWLERLRAAGLQLGLPSWVTGAGFAVLLLSLSAVLAVGMVRSARALARALAESAFPPVAPDRADASAAPRRALGLVLLLLITLGTGLVLIAVLQPFVRVLPLTAVLLVLLVALAVNLWRTAADLEGHAKAGAAALFEILLAQRRAPAETDVPAEVVVNSRVPMIPGFGRVLSIPLAEGNPAAGRTLTDLRLRALTGATIVAIRRGNEKIVFPTGKSTARAGDVLLVTGTEEALGEAERLLNAFSTPTGEGGRS